jgi:hypothetical protein
VFGNLWPFSSECCEILVSFRVRFFFSHILQALLESPFDLYVTVNFSVVCGFDGLDAADAISPFAYAAARLRLAAIQNLH